METSLLFRLEAHVISAFLFIGMIVTFTLGKMLSKIWHTPGGDAKGGGVGALLGALFALFGLILAFTFGMSGSRYEGVRNVMVAESNNISTVILRTELYPDSLKETLKKELRIYLEARIAYYDHVRDANLFQKARDDAERSGAIIWNSVARISKMPNMTIPSMQMVPALNNMLDIASARDVALKARVPDAIVLTLLILTLTISFIGGFTTPTVGAKDWVVIVGFAMLTSLIIYLTLDLGRPMRGLIKADLGQQSILDLRKLF